LSLRDWIRTPQRIRRLAHIARVLARHGQAHIVHQLNLQRYLRSMHRFRRQPVPTRRVEAGLTPAQRLPIVLEELGPTFVKLGQMLSTRPDLLPEEYVRELGRLQDRVAPFPAAQAREAVESALGKPISVLFVEFADEPMASGSIAQAHAARLPSGERVVVKVRRPGVERMIRADLDLMQFIAERAERVAELKIYRPRMLADEFARTLERELNFVTEASYTEKFGEIFRDNPRVRTPKVFWNYTTASVLTLEHLEGISVARRAELERMGVNLSELAATIADAFFTQYFRAGIFHADPHPGNILVRPDGSIGLLDFGMVGHIEDEMRALLGTGLIAIVRRQLDLVVDVYAEMGILPDDVDYAALKMDMVEMLDKYYGIPIKLVDMQRAFGDMMRVARAHRIIFPRDVVLLGKSLTMMAALTRQLDPDFNLARVVRPHALALAKEKFSPARTIKEMATMLWQISNLLRRLPREAGQLTRKVLQGRMQLVLRIPELEGLLSELDRATNRLAFSIIIGAVVIGSSFLIHARIPPFFGQLPGIGPRLHTIVPDLSVLGTAGYLVAAVMGLLLAWAIWRSGRL